MDCIYVIAVINAKNIVRARLYGVNRPVDGRRPSNVDETDSRVFINCYFINWLARLDFRECTEEFL